MRGTGGLTRRPPRRLAGRVLLLGLAIAAGGCGLNVQSADLFVLTRTGAGRTLSLLVSDGGTIRCNGGKSLVLPDQLLLQARDLATDLDNDVKAHRHFGAGPGTIYRFSVKLQDGTLSFPDTAAAGHPELARAELFTLQVAQAPCKLATA